MRALTHTHTRTHAYMSPYLCPCASMLTGTELPKELTPILPLDTIPCHPVRYQSVQYDASHWTSTQYASMHMYMQTHGHPHTHTHRHLAVGTKPLPHTPCVSLALNTDKNRCPRAKKTRFSESRSHHQHLKGNVGSTHHSHTNCCFFSLIQKPSNCRCPFFSGNAWVHCTSHPQNPPSETSTPHRGAAIAAAGLGKRWDLALALLEGEAGSERQLRGG